MITYGDGKKLRIVSLSNLMPRGFGFVHHSIAILYHEVPNLSITIRNFCIAVHHMITYPSPSVGTE